jgi:hypothetical protein
MSKSYILNKLTEKQKKSRLHKIVFSVNPYGRLGYTKADRLGNRTYAQALEENPYAGIYRRRRRKGKLYIQKAPFYKPTQVHTDKQQAWRKVFADACFLWFSLSDGEKKFYNLWGAKYQISGWNKFISEYCKSQYAKLVK